MLIDRKIVYYLAIWFLDRLTKGHYRLIDRKIVYVLPGHFVSRQVD